MFYLINRFLEGIFAFTVK